MSDETFEKYASNTTGSKTLLKNKYFKVVDGQKSIENVVLSVKNIIFNEL